MSVYEDDDRFEPIAPIQPIRRTRAIRALRVLRPRPYVGERFRRPPQTASETQQQPAAILDISPQAREQAHHSGEIASDPVQSADAPSDHAL